MSDYPETVDPRENPAIYARPTAYYIEQMNWIVNSDAGEWVRQAAKGTADRLEELDAEWQKRLDDLNAAWLQRLAARPVCPTCNGEPCPSCGGSGMVVEQHDHGASEMLGCHDCHGERCPDCEDGKMPVELEHVIVQAVIDHASPHSPVNDDIRSFCTYLLTARRPT